MAKIATIKLEIPGTPGMFDMPGALHDRLHELLDRQDQEGKLSARERREAEALVQLAQTLSLLKISARKVQQKRGA